MSRRRALGAMLITAPTDAERMYDLAVRVARAEIRKTYIRVSIAPWIRIRANEETGAVTLACGLRPKRLGTETQTDGA